MKTAELYKIIILILVLGLGILALFQTSGAKNQQLIIIILLSLIYVAWGIMHHLHKNDFHARIMIEYILIAAIVVMLTLTLLS